MAYIGKLRRAAVEIVHNLSEDNRDNRSTVYNLLLQRHNAEAFYHDLITKDEKLAL